MSTYKRKLGYYAMEFVSGERRFFNADTFSRFIQYIGELNGPDLILNDVKNNKAISVDSIQHSIPQNMSIFKIIFKTCKL